jgi:hypothetical protein
VWINYYNLRHIKIEQRTALAMDLYPLGHCLISCALPLPEFVSRYSPDVARPKACLMSRAQKELCYAGGRKTALEVQGLPEGCARFYWLARYVFGYHNPTWPTAKIITLIQWFTKRGQKAGDGVFVKWGKWLLGTHRIGQWDHMKPEYRHRLPAIEARYQEWMARIT